jgi:hypothetical protein
VAPTLVGAAFWAGLFLTAALGAAAAGMATAAGTFTAAAFLAAAFGLGATSAAEVLVFFAVTMGTPRVENVRRQSIGTVF